MNCPCASVGWQRSDQDAFIREFCRGTPPPIPDLQPETNSNLAPCGLPFGPVPACAFCSLCFDPVERAVRLHDGELLCAVCSSATFESAQQHETIARACVALLAETVEGHVRPDELDELRGRGLSLMSLLRVGETVRFCGCLPFEHVRGREARFVGYDVRRHLALLQIGEAIVGMRMMSAEDPLMLRPTRDEATGHHDHMLRSMLRFASARTLQAAMSMVQAAHTLCGSTILAEAEAVLARLRREEGMPEAGGVRDTPPTPMSHTSNTNRLLESPLESPLKPIRGSFPRGMEQRVRWTPITGVR